MLWIIKNPASRAVSSDLNRGHRKVNRDKKGPSTGDLAMVADEPKSIPYQQKGRAVSSSVREEK